LAPASGPGHVPGRGQSRPVLVAIQILTPENIGLGHWPRPAQAMAGPRPF